MKEIPLTRGQVALVDDEDFELVSQYKWRALPDRSNPPKFRAVTGTKMLFMHRLIMQCKQNERVDHKNRDSLDNRRENLRTATPMQNSWNTTPNSKSQVPYKGVRFFTTHRLNKPYYARITYQQRTLHLGFYRTAIEAAQAYDRKAVELFGEFACTNFPTI